LIISLNVPFQVIKYEWNSNVNIKEQNRNEVTLEIPDGFKEKIYLTWKALSLTDTSRYLSVYCMNITPAPGESIVSQSATPLPKDENTEIDGGWKNLPTEAGINNPNVYFDFDSYRLNSDEKNKLEKIAGWITKNGYQIRIQAYADDRGSDNYNIELSQKRALTIKNFLIKNGVNASDIIEVVGKGKFPMKDIRYVEQRIGELKIRKKQ
jgi:outer membrane protein OmpA-like peptidoglycan-associated protein